MKEQNKVLTILLTSLLLFSAAIIIIPAEAYTPPWTVSTYSYIVVEPTPIGVGQTAYITYWMNRRLPFLQPQALGSDRQ